MTPRDRYSFSIALCTIAAFLASCAENVPIPPRAIVDLSPTITEDLPLRMWGSKPLNDFGFREITRFEHVVVEDTSLGLYAVDSYLTLFNHAGPHHDAPSHMIKGAKTTDEFPLDRFFGPARVLDFRLRPKHQPIPADDFRGQGIRPGDIVIAFVGYTAPSDPNELPSYPYLSVEAAEYLASIPVRAFGTDALGVDGIPQLYRAMEEGVTGFENLLPVHHAFLSREVTVIEQLVNLDKLVDEKNVVFVGFPLKIQAGNGSPMRAAALLY